MHIYFPPLSLRWLVKLSASDDFIPNFSLTLEFQTYPFAQDNEKEKNKIKKKAKIFLPSLTALCIIYRTALPDCQVMPPGVSTI